MKTMYNLIVGEADEIRAVEKSMRRAWENGRSNLWPSHLGRPRYRAGRVYGISIERGDYHDTYYVVTADTALRLMLDEGRE